MIRCNIKKGKPGRLWVTASGTAEDLTAETGALIQAVYQNINKTNPEAAEGYKLHLLGLLLDPSSPVWKEPDHG